ncbi:MAG: phosphatidylinositol alpha-mannosyltransferase [Desulfuromonas sp.]|uniref:glycosyltransferase family 4 protein n=1 Tax=Desulfuromonas sp. TaxID=892 RepID=UPI000CC8CE08|nr:glycosyltransferase [Desulfuromonas sp.]PLX82006.1 MAG: phosphatidylinositol alpha-mannosyltransferase [Desulfuromonas sp.]
MKRKITFVITGLGTGGAEMMLFKLLSRMDKNDFVPEVISMTDYVPLKVIFDEIGVPVKTLGMRRGVPELKGIYRLVKAFRWSDPDLVQTWMYHADLIGGIAAKLSGNLSVVWNIRNSNLDPSSSKKTTIMTAKTCAIMSKYLPRKIICCAEEARRVHEKIGYDSKKITTIPNGFDLDSFKPDPVGRNEVREELGISKDSFIVGLVARYDPQKDHKNFVHAAQMFKSLITKVDFVLCGDGINYDNEELTSMLDSSGVRDRFHLLGRRSDIPRIVSSFDLKCSSSSYGEAFSNSIGEAMACGVPCVVTDVGDSAYIVGDTGKVVKPRDSESLCMAWYGFWKMHKDERMNLGNQARQRILEMFSLDTVVEKYENIYRDILN